MEGNKVREPHWEQMVMAMQALGEVTICMRAPGNWYVRCAGVERVEGVMLSGGCQAEATPELAVMKKWQWLTSKEYPVLRVPRAGGEVKWNGFMWEKVTQ